MVLVTKLTKQIYLRITLSGFGGLDVACWPLVPKFAGSNPTETVWIFQGEKILSTPSFGRGVVDLRHVKDP